MAAYVTVRAADVREGDALWRNDETGRGFVVAVSRTLNGFVCIEWHDGATGVYSPNKAFAKKEDDR